MYLQIDGRTRAVSDVVVEQIARGLEGALASQSREERRTITAADIVSIGEAGIELPDSWGSVEQIAAVVRGLADAK